MYLDSFAEVFAAAGLNVLVFDNRNFGASDGEPRQEIDPWAQVRDYRHAITYAGTPARGGSRTDRDLGQQLLGRLAIAAYEKAHQPKELVILPGGHFDAYTVGFEASSGPARDWFVRHLAP